jgi:two-component system, NtrC family, sensor histidine kinase AtoS
MIPFLSKSNLNITSIRTILDQIERPCLLWDEARNRIIQLNRQWEALTSLRLVDLENVNITKFILDFDLKKPFNEDIKYLIKTKGGNMLECGLRSYRLESDGILFLIILNSDKSTVQKIGKSKEIIEVLDSFSSFNNGGIRDFTDHLINTFSKIFDYDEFACYFGGESLKLSLITHSKKVHIFPIAINVGEFDFNNPIEFWRSGERTLNEIQRLAKQENISFLAEINLKLVNNHKMVLILFFRNKVYDEANFVLFPGLITIISEKTNKIIEAKSGLSNEKDAIFENPILVRMIENIKEGILIIDQDKIIKQCNTSAQRIIGYNRWEIVGEPIQRILPNLEIKFRSNEEDLDLYFFNLEFSRRDGYKIFTNVGVCNLKVLLANDQYEIFYEIIVEDISSLKTLQTEKSQLIRQAEMGILVASFAHDVRNVFNSIQLNADAAQMAFPEINDLKEKMEIIKDECEEINQLMESVLSYSSSFERNKQTIDVYFLLERLLDRWKPKLHKLNIKSILQSEEDIPKIIGDPRSLEQVFNNLIGNAKDAMRQNGGTLGIYISRVDKGQKQFDVEIKLSDSGAGIPEELIEKIFDPYFSTRPEGTGLGLAITKKIVEIHQGKVMVESFPGGTTFKIQFPAIKSEIGEKQ